MGAAETQTGQKAARPGHPTWCTDDELDVIWYFCDAPAAAAGMRSNLGAQLEALEVGCFPEQHHCTDPDGAMVDRLDAATRAAKVHRRMVAIGHVHTEVLFALYGGETPAADLRVKWGALAAVVLALVPRALGRTKGMSVELLRTQAEKAVQEAKAAYVSARFARPLPEVA